MFYCVSCNKFTCGVEIDDKDVIILTAPILQKFKGQHINNLKKWMNKKFYGVQIKEIT